MSRTHKPKLLSGHTVVPVVIPDYPFQLVAADLFELAGKQYLLVVHYFRNWTCAVQLKTTTRATVVFVWSCCSLIISEEACHSFPRT